MRFSIVHKISLLIVILVTGSVAVVSGLFYIDEKQLLVQQTLDRLSNQIVESGARLNSQIGEVRADTRLLANVPPIQGLLRARNNQGVDVQGVSTSAQWRQRLQTIFSVLLDSKPNYLMARFLAADGEELVRVERFGDDIQVTPQNGLQNKAGRDYVIETLKLPSGTVYLSEINLNREFGEIVLPHQEVLRSATPIYDAQNGSLAGLVVINLDMGETLLQIGERSALIGGDIFITNDKGDYLFHADNGKTYGFDLGEIYRIQDDFPAAAGLFDSDNTDEKIILLPEDTHNSGAGVFNKFFFDPLKPQRFFVIGLHRSYDLITAEIQDNLNRVLFFVIILIIFTMLVSILLSQRIVRPIKLMTRAVDDYSKDRTRELDLPVHQQDEIGTLAKSFQDMAADVREAEKNLRELNVNLEELVEERTQELKRSEDRHRIIVENIVDGLISINEQGIIQDYNRAAEGIFGYSAKEAIGKNIKMLMPEQFAVGHDGYIKAYLDGGEAKIIGIGREVEGKRKDGGTFPMDLAISELWLGGERYFSGIVRDITERKEMDKMKNEFISTVSHELRTPLTSIRGSMGLLLGGAMGELPDKALELLRIASSNSERLLMLINDILDIQKMESGMIKLHMEPILLMPFLDRAVEEHASYGEQCQVSFEIRKRLDGAEIFSDRARLMQVIANLLSNAAKFSPPGARVTICVEIPRPGYLRIAVVDSGPGIPINEHSAVFERFTQVDSSDSRDSGGTGLGLAISKTLVEMLGGTIGLESLPGEGSTFYIDLPVNPQ